MSDMKSFGGGDTELYYSPPPGGCTDVLPLLFLIQRSWTDEASAAAGGSTFSESLQEAKALPAFAEPKQTNVQRSRRKKQVLMPKNK